MLPDMSLDQIKEQIELTNNRYQNDLAGNEKLPPYEYTVPHMMIYDPTGAWWYVESLCFNYKEMVGVRKDYITRDEAEEHPLYMYLVQVRKEVVEEKQEFRLLGFFEEKEEKPKRWRTYFNFWEG